MTASPISTRPGASSDSNGIWQTLLQDLTPYARSRVESLFSSNDRPPFLPFVMQALGKDSGRGRPGASSAPLMESIVIRAISDPAILNLKDAIGMARIASKIDDHLDFKLLDHLTAPDATRAGHVRDAETFRVLEVLDQISDCRRLVMPLLKFFKVSHPQQRSKIVKLIARANQNSGWADSLLADPDPRVRSNLIEGFNSQTGPHIESLLRKAAQDPHHRVATTALLGLAQRGDQISREELHKLAAGADKAYKLAAQWALGQLKCETGVPAEPAVPVTTQAV